MSMKLQSFGTETILQQTNLRGQARSRVGGIYTLETAELFAGGCSCSSIAGPGACYLLLRALSKKASIKKMRQLRMQIQNKLRVAPASDENVDNIKESDWQNLYAKN